MAGLFIVSATVMFRRLATLLLVVPLSLNGLWMVCASGEPAVPATQTAKSQAGAKPHCKFMCPAQKPAQPGAICVLTANVDGSSIALFAVAVTTPPAVVDGSVSQAVAEYLPQPDAIYASPSLAFPTPPPEV